MRTLTSITVVLALTVAARAQDLRQSIVELLRETRTIDGSGNHPADFGRAGTAMRRIARSDYGDGVKTPAGENRPSARVISNFVCSQTTSSTGTVSDFVWQWGQFVDHDIDETPTAHPAEPFDITVPTGDPWFDPNSTGAALIGLSRSHGEDEDGVRQQVNEITAFIDASNVYGSDATRAVALRTLDGTGRLAMSAGDLLPFNELGLPNAPSSSVAFFLAGDFRANEQVGLTAMHTLFVREHNMWAKRIRSMFDGAASDDVRSDVRGRRDSRRAHRSARTQLPARLTGDQIYEAARAMVAAEMQAITYREFLPIVLGGDAIPRYRGYRSDVDPRIANEFATASYRFGHTMLSPQLRRLDAFGRSIPAGDLPLSNAFFNPTATITEGIEPVLRGLAAQRAQRIDTQLVDDVRNFLFGAPGSGGFDLASLNIQRGRDHGLPSYNQLRRDLGLRPMRSIREVSSDPETQRRLAAVYASVDDIDAWVGGLAEDPARGALVGPTIRAVLARQFTALRDGDRYYYERSLPRALQRIVEQSTLARIIRRNTKIEHELPDDVWHVR